MELSRILASGKEPETLLHDETHQKAWILHSKGITSLAHNIRRIEHVQGTARTFENIRWKPFQQWIITKCGERPDPRRVHWFVDYEGNAGKTYLSMYLMCCGALRLENSKSADIKYAYNGHRVVVFDFSRSVEENFNYQAIESIKNGCVFSTKYECVSKLFEQPHVFVFSNVHPVESKLSKDRWDIHIITDEERQLPDERMNVDKELSLRRADTMEI